jgi:hypothetical protein
MDRKLEILIREEYRKLLAESVAEQESSIQSQVKKGLEFADKKPADLDIPVEHLDDAENAKQNLLNLIADPLSEASDEDTSIAKRILKKELAEYKDHSELTKEVGRLLQFLGMGTAASTTMLGIAGTGLGVLSLFGNSPLMGAAMLGGGGAATATVGLLVAYLLGSAGKAIEDLSTGLGDESGRVRQDYKTYWREKLGALPPDTQQEVLQGLERYLVLRRQSELITMGAMYPDHRQPTEREQALNKQKSEAFKTWSKHFSLSEKWPFWESWYAEHRNLYDMSRDKLARQKMQKFQDKQAALELDAERARTAGRVALPTAGSERGRVSVPRATTGGGRVSKIDENVKRIIREEYKKLLAESEPLPGALPGKRMPATVQMAAAVIGFWRDYGKMKEANTKLSDKYFHCLAHCLATTKGPYGETVSRFIGWAREVTDVIRKGDPEWAVNADYVANSVGRLAAQSGGCGGCWRYIPNGLPEEYWVLPPGLDINQARQVISRNTEQNPDFMDLVGEKPRAELLRWYSKRGGDLPGS